MTTQKSPYLVNTKLPETATVSYYDVESDQNLTVEEWNKLNFLNQEDVSISPDGRHVYISEKAFNKGAAMYGPNWWDDWGSSVAKKVGSIALATTYFTPAVVITGPLTVGALAGGGAALAIGHATDDKDAKEIGGFIFGTAFDAAAEGLGAATLNPGAPLLAKGVKEFCGVYNAAGDFLDPTSRGMPGPDQRAKIAGYLIKNL